MVYDATPDRAGTVALEFNRTVRFPPRLSRGGCAYVQTDREAMQQDVARYRMISWPAVPDVGARAVDDRGRPSGEPFYMILADDRDVIAPVTLMNSTANTSAVVIDGRKVFGPATSFDDITATQGYLCSLRYYFSCDGRRRGSRPQRVLYMPQIERVEVERITSRRGGLVHEVGVRVHLDRMFADQFYFLPANPPHVTVTPIQVPAYAEVCLGRTRTGTWDCVPVRSAGVGLCWG